MDWSDLSRAGAALALTLGLVLATGWAARRLHGARPQWLAALGAAGGGARAPARLAVSASVWLEPGRARLFIVAVDGGERLLAVSPAGLCDLGPLPAQVGDAVGDAGATA